MSTVFRRLIQDVLEGMEAGRFQDFCLEFFPIWSSRFEGLQRFGHNVAGKTRAGTPDLLKTDDAGDQIAVQCGTEDDYWRWRDVIESKPYKDAFACLARLTSPVEIVLVSNREVPTNAPNAKAVLIAAVGDRRSVLVTPVSVDEISAFVASSLNESRTLVLLRTYFPEVSQAIGADVDRRRYAVASAVAEVRSVDANVLFDLTATAIAENQDLDTAREYIIEQIDTRSRFRLPRLPRFRVSAASPSLTLRSHFPSATFGAFLASLRLARQQRCCS